jgi:cytochrome b pre-mRNA-processing protein 3
MTFVLFRRRARPDTISALYGTIVAQARMQCFYRDYAVADTVNGRFELIVLHLALVLERLAAEPALKGLAQALFDRFWQDMDDNLRQMGVGDLSVPRRMRDLGEAYYGRLRAYRAALTGAACDAALAEALARNVYSGRRTDAARRLAAYVRAAVGELAAQAAEALARGAVRFPDPRAVALPAC